MPWMWSYFLCVALALGASTRVKAFTFNFTPPAQCQNLSITWTGGQPPFQLLIIPPDHPNHIVDIPSSAYQGNSGSYSAPPLPVKQGQSLLLSMSDATGVSAGGISDLLTVGPPPQGAIQCNTADQRGDFYFSLDGELQQCMPYTFSQYEGAIQPITIIGFIPLGNSFTLNPPIGNNFSWTANLLGGTSVAFRMTDSKGRVGGTSPIVKVNSTNDNSCLITSNPTTVVASSGGGAVSSSGSTVTSSETISTPYSAQSSNFNSDGNNIGTSKAGSKIKTIIGASVGGFAAVGIAAFLFFYFSRIRRTKSGYGPAQNVHFNYDPVRPSIDPFILPAGHTSASPVPSKVSPRNNALVSLPTPAQHAGTATPLASLQFSNSNMPQGLQPQVILHTDIEESMQLPMELPPEYSASRAPILSQSASGSSSALASMRIMVTERATRF